jgi:hypothetical protein
MLGGKRQHKVLDPSPDDPAAQKKGIDPACFVA